MIHLDTSFLIRALSAGTSEHERLRRWVEQGTPLAMSSLALCEFLCGDRAQGGDLGGLAHVIGPALPAGPAEAELAARLFNQSGRRRHSLIDCLIAATALVHGASLATCNTADFRRFPELDLEPVHAD